MFGKPPDPYQTRWAISKMNKTNFTAPSPNTSHDAAVTLEFFSSAGSTEHMAAGKIIFAEGEKGNRLFLQRDKMYLLLEGEVGLTINGKPVGAARKGEIFGEMASITQTTRSATATAKTACTLISLDDKQFQAALCKKPEFALVMISILAGRLRKMIARLNENSALSADEEWKESRVFDKKLLASLVNELGDSARVNYLQGKAIMQEGQTGVMMYVVLEGRVAVSIHNRVVEKIGPGGMFGEMALIERTERLASAVAETDCSLLAINRNVFLDMVRYNPAFGVALLSAIGERVRFMASHYAL